MKNKRIIYRISNIGITLAVIAVLIMINFFVKDASWRIDLTDAGIHKLTQKTIDYIQTLDKETKILLLQKDETPDDYVVKIVKLYPKYNKKIKVETLDPDKNPSLMTKYLKKDSSLIYGSIVIDNGDNWELVNKAGTVTRDRNGNIVSKVERKITSAIYKINTEQKNTIYMLTGHGEFGIGEIYQIKEDLGDILYSVNELNLLAEGKIPEDIYSLAILGPRGDIGEDEKNLILEYMKNGGKLTLLLDIDVKGEKYKNLQEIVKEYNISVDDNYICEDEGHSIQDLPMALIPTISPNEITQEFIGSKINIFMPSVRSISILDENNKDVQITPLLVTSKGSWEKRDLENPKKTDTDKMGPFNLAVAATKVKDDVESKLVVFGSSSIIDSQILARYATLGNKDLFITTLKWFGDEEINMLDIPEKVEKQEFYSISAKTARNLILGAVAVPMVFLIAGVFTYLKRRD